MTGLADLVVDHALFLATAGDEEIDPDVAVEQLEALAHRARGLPADEQAALREAIRARAEGSSGDRRATLDELAENLGL
jgi:hypothetical protein